MSTDGDVYACPACRRPSCRACERQPETVKAACRACRRRGRPCHACLGRGDIWVLPDVRRHPGSLGRVLQAVAEDGIALPGARLVDDQVAYGADCGVQPLTLLGGHRRPPERLAPITSLFRERQPTDRAAASTRLERQPERQPARRRTR